MLDVAQLVESGARNCLEFRFKLNISEAFEIYLAHIKSIQFIKDSGFRREQIELEIGEQNYCHVFS